MRERMGILPAGLVLGVAGDLLLRAPGAPGLGMSVWIAFVAVVAAGVHARLGGRLSGEARLLLLAGVAYAAMLAFRDAPALKLLALGSAFVLFSLPALRRGAAWVLSGSPSEYVAAIAGTGISGAFGAVPALADADWSGLRSTRSPAVRHAAAATRGVVLAVPFVLVFGGLLIAADAVFASVVAATIRVDLETLASHAALTGVLAWAVTGYVRGLTRGTAMQLALPEGVRRTRVGVVEAAVLLGLLNLLFLLFVLVQFRYLFGGASLVEITPGLTYAEYARRGFFELVLVTLLVVPLLLSVDWLLRGAAVAPRSVVRAFSGVQIVLVLTIAASALQRMSAYRTAYGLTEQRLYATALLVLVSAVLVCFASTVLRGRRRQFMPGALAAALVTVAALHVLNPDALIARTNIERAAVTELDARYLAGLSGDAVPVLLAHLSELPQETRCTVARRVLHRFDAASPPRRAWSWSAARAGHAVHRHRAELAELTERCVAVARR